MATATEIIKEGFRELNLLAVNVDVTTEQQAEALGLLNTFIESLYGLELGEFAMDWLVPPSFTATVLSRFPLGPLNNEGLPDTVWPFPPENVRLLLNLTIDTTVFFPPLPNDGARIQVVNVGDPTTFTITLDGNGRLIKGAATLVDTPGNLTSTNFLYRADLGNWTAVAPMTLTDTSPFPVAFDGLLVTGLAIRLSPRFGRGVSKETIAAFSQQMKRLKTQYKQSRLTPTAVPQPFLVPASRKNGNFGQGGGSLF